LNACAFDFYAQPENWKYLPNNVDVIVFPKTVFHSSSGNRYVWSLYRSGSAWNRSCHWLGGRFYRGSRVAVLAS
jgi:hypothetical protein